MSPRAWASYGTPAPGALGRAHRPWFDPWFAGAIACASIVVLPVLAVIWLALFPTENIWPHLWATVLDRYVATTLLLMFGVAVGTLLIGVSSAWLVTMCRFPGVSVLAWALLLPLAVPAYVIAYVYTDLLEYAGPVQRAMRAVFGWNSAADYAFPEIRSLGGAVCMLSLVLYPYVYMLSRAAFMSQSNKMLQAASTLGHGPWRRFFSVSLPLARPAVAVGLAFALMETLGDFGTVDFFAVRTLTAGLYDVWLGMGNLGGAAQIATCMLAFVVLLIVLEQFSRRRQRHFQLSGKSEALERFTLRGWRAWVATAVCLLPLLAGFAVPAVVLLVYSVTYFESSWTPEFHSYASNSLLLAAVAASAAVIVALVLAYAKRLHRGRALSLSARIASLGYAIPGAVLAIGVIVPLAAFDNGVDALMRRWFGVSTGLILSGTVFALLLAYVVRFMAIAIGTVDAGLSKITPNMDMAARTLGHGRSAAFVRVHLPIMRASVLSALLVVFVDCMKELPATLILRPFNFDTLATHVYQYASDQMIEQASLGALLIVLAGLVPVIVLSRTISGATGT
ncbi:MAG: ABC transporter permease [Gammaproteobacteria bacterium]